VALLVPKKMDPAGTAAALGAVYDELAKLETWSEGQLEEALRALVEQLGLKAGQLFGAVRVAITGRTVAPPLFETLATLGRERSLARIAAARAAVGG
jgi:glutamyl-tRNA synthetase